MITQAVSLILMSHMLSISQLAVALTHALTKLVAA